MAWIRQLDSGLWAGTIYAPNGERITETREHKHLIKAWAQQKELEKRQGNFIDPRLARKTVGEVWELYGQGRRLEKASRKRDASHWRAWVGPRWADVPIGSILKPDVTAWVVSLELRGHDPAYPGDPVGGWTIIGCLALLRSLLEIAVDARMLHFNPARGVKGPRPPRHEDRNLTDAECDALLANLYARFPDRPEAGLMCEVMAYCGLRYEEAAALKRGNAIDMRNRMLYVHPVMLKDGTIKEQPKSEAGGRWVPVDDELWPRLRDHVMTVLPGSLVFTAPDGGPLLYDNWRKRVWLKGLATARQMTADEIETWKAERIADGKRPWRVRWVIESPVVADPQPTPHDLRHLYGTRLAEAGMVPHERMSLMGHEDERSGRRYTNPREERFARARSAMRSFRRSTSH